jgi:hypothetical protein
MKIKVKQSVKLDEEDFDQVLAQYLRNIIDRAGTPEGVHGPQEHIIEAMKFTHDWFAYPDKWYHTVEELEGPKTKPAKIKAKKK